MISNKQFDKLKWTKSRAEELQGFTITDIETISANIKGEPVGLILYGTDSKGKAKAVIIEAGDDATLIFISKANITKGDTKE